MARIDTGNFYGEPAAKRENTERRNELWTALNKFVTKHGGRVVSLPNVKVLRIEIPQGSVLPDELASLGYSVRPCGSATRIMPLIETITAHSTGKPIVRRQAGLGQVDVIEIEMGN